MSVWDDLVGQEAAISELSAAAAGQGMTHAWLITGPPGSGRSNAARAFAAALLTEDHGASLSPEAQRALSGTHESMTMLRTQKSVISIDEVRQLVSTSQSSPVNADWRVIIIEDADRMAERTSNVLLKAIEEPPPTTVWILCAPSPEDVLTTIRSRCRTVGLRIPPAEAVAQLLVNRDGVDPSVPNGLLPPHRTTSEGPNIWHLMTTQLRLAAGSLKSRSVSHRSAQQCGWRVERSKRRPNARKSAQKPAQKRNALNCLKPWVLNPAKQCRRLCARR